MFEKEAEIYALSNYGFRGKNSQRVFTAKIDFQESETASYLVQLRNKDVLICEWETEEGFGCFWDSNLEPIDNDDVYAWKEIVLPKESE